MPPGAVPSWPPAGAMPREGAGAGGIAILGGSFNPLHTAHLRLAIEVHEHLGCVLSRVDLLPCANPPHKRAEGLLPFALRLEMLRAATAAWPWMCCNPLEGERESPSWTWDTLGIYRERHPGRGLYFVLGSEDYANLATWKRGLDLDTRCTLVVLPRVEAANWDFARVTRSLWPSAMPAAVAWAGGQGNGRPQGPGTGAPDGSGCRAAEAVSPAGPAGAPEADPERWESAQALARDHALSCMWTGRGHVLCLDVPWLNISATDIRRRWLAGRSLDLLVPAPAVEVMERRREILLAHWKRG